jgi:hypothetical protein
LRPKRGRSRPVHSGPSARRSTGGITVVARVGSAAAPSASSRASTKPVALAGRASGSFDRPQRSTSAAASHGPVAVSGSPSTRARAWAIAVSPANGRRPHSSS